MSSSIVLAYAARQRGQPYEWEERMFKLFFGKKDMPEADKEMNPTVFFTRVLWAADNPDRLAALKREYAEALKPAA